MQKMIEVINQIHVAKKWKIVEPFQITIFLGHPMHLSQI
jgi:hypothetical protein